MKRYTKESETILAMSNVRGSKVKVESIPFSFYYSVKNSNHGPRVKVSMNVEKLRPNKMSTMKLCDDWSIIINKEDAHITDRDVDAMKVFFRKYLVLFLLVWEDLIDEPSLGDYMEDDITFSEFIQNLDFYDEYKSDLDNIADVSELEDFCRIHNLVNFYGN